MLVFQMVMGLQWVCNRYVMISQWVKEMGRSWVKKHIHIHMYMYIEWVIQHILIYMYTLVLEETEKCTYPSGYSTRKNGDLGWVYGIECSSSNQNICINPVVNQMRLYATPHSYGFVLNIVCRRYKKHKHDKDT